MSRSLYKLGYIHRSTLKNCLLNKKKIKRTGKIFDRIKKTKNIPANMYFWNRSSTINETLLNKKIGVYNGHVFITVNVNKNLIGTKLGSFSVTRQKPYHTGKIKQIKKVQRSNVPRIAAAQKRIQKEQNIRKKRKKANK